MIAVYVAASALELDRAARAIAMLEAAGIRVVSTWIQSIAAAGGVSNPRDVSAAQRRAWSVADFDELMVADVLWFLAPSTPTRGAWAELGCAYALSKRIVCSGDTGQSIFCALGEEYADDGAALTAIVTLLDRELDAVPRVAEDDETPDKIVIALEDTRPVENDDASDPTWVGEGPRRARERLARRGR